MNYYNKYCKYKTKYLQLKYNNNQYGGVNDNDPPILHTPIQSNTETQSYAQEQDKQIEEYEEKEENGRDASYKELEEAYELLNQKRWKEKDEHNKTIVDYATRCNILIDELRILRKQKNETSENI